MKRYIIRVAGLLLVTATLLQFGACTKEMLEPTLAQEKDIEQAKDEMSLQATLAGGYDHMSAINYYGRDYIIYGEIRSDNCFSTGHSNRFVSETSGTFLPTYATQRNTWSRMYAVIAQANAVLVNTQSGSIAGQAYAMRALAHFDLFKLYGAAHVNGGEGGVPYIAEFKNPDNATPGRTTGDAFKNMLYADLDKAIAEIPSSFKDCNYLTQGGAHAIKARVAQYFGDWAVAKQEAEAVINGGGYIIMPKEQYIASWLKKKNPNSIFEIAFNDSDNPYINGLANIYRGKSYGDVVASKELKACFETGDVRGDMIADNEEMKAAEPDLGYYLANLGKYTDHIVGQDNVRIIRYEEVVLIYAEALLQTGDAGKALTQLNLIAAARGATPFTEATEDNILLERRRELCFEGFRFDDLARTKRDVPAIEVPATIVKASPKYGTKLFSFPIPQAELTANANLKQNPGY